MPLTLLIKPASSLCQMRCRYCFYCDEASNRAVPSYGIMSDEVMRTVIERAFEGASDRVDFAFQGGEPTLAGLDYFKRFIAYVNETNTAGIPVGYSFQTNGLMTDGEEWADFFARNKFLVGLSFDGTRELHDLHRVDAAGKGTAARVIRTAALFDRFGVQYNILTVVGDTMARHIAKVYAFLRKQGWNYQQYIPCLAPLDGSAGVNVLTEEGWLTFNCRLFDLWYADNIRSLAQGGQLCVSVRHLDDYLRMAAGLPPTSCSVAGQCWIQNVVESDGSVYPCDFYALDEYRMGNVAENSFAELAESRQGKGFVSDQPAEKCRKCQWYPFCRGGCRRMKRESEFMYCASSVKFYEYTYDRIRHMAGYVIR